MQFYTDEKRNAQSKLTGANPKKLYVPLNAGRRVGPRPNKSQGSFVTKTPADQVELTEWIDARFNGGDIKMDTTITTVTADNSGTFSYTAAPLSSDTTYLYNTQLGVGTLVLPAAADSAGKRITVIRTGTGTNAITIDGNASETINGAANLATLDAQYDSVTLLCDGTGWVIVASNIA